MKAGLCERRRSTFSSRVRSKEWAFFSQDRKGVHPMKVFSILAASLSLLTCLNTAHADTTNTSNSIHTTAVSQPTCKDGDAPAVVKPMENWEIIATNTGKIKMSPVFYGDNLAYTLLTHPTNRKNLVTIN
jgi:hypothetical protein